VTDVAGPRRGLHVTRPLAAVLSIAASLAACGGGADPSSDGVIFRVSPVDPTSIVYIIPLGNLNPPGHTLPTSHIYLNNRQDFVTPPPRSPVLAPADGEVKFIFRSGAEAKIGIKTDRVTYHLAHVELDGNIREGTAVTAGQRIGVTGSTSLGIDLGVINEDRTVFFVNPARYTDEERHGDAPLQYFEEPLRSQLYARVRRLGQDRNGRFDFDQSGRLAGNWFLEGLSASESSQPSGWPKQLAFVYDNYDPASIRVSVGGTLPLVGAFAVQPGALDPKDVTVTSGKVTYRLLVSAPTAGPGRQVGVLIVQMVAAERTRVEITVGETLVDADFTGAAKTYIR